MARTTFLLLAGLLASLLSSVLCQERQWGELEPLEGGIRPRAECAFGICGKGKYCLLGGRGVGPADIYDVEKRSWTPGSAPPFQMHHFQAVTFNDCAWVLGAWTANYPFEKNVNEVWRYCAADDKWQMMAPMPKGRERGAAAAVAYKGKLYVVGGNVGGHGEHAMVVPWFDEWDPQSGQWTQLKDMPNPRDHFQAAIVGDLLVCPGGRDSGVANFFQANEKLVNVYDFGKAEWRTLKATVPTPRAGGMVGVLGGVVVFAGGEGEGQAYDTVEFLDVDKDEWTTGPKMTSRRHGTGMITAPNALVVVAGVASQGGGAIVRTMEVLEGDSTPPGPAPSTSPVSSASPSAAASPVASANPAAASSPDGTSNDSSTSPTPSEIPTVTPTGGTSSTGGSTGSPSPSSSPSGSIDDDGDDGGSSQVGGGDDNERVCFPGSSVVELSSGAYKRMSELQIGDIVRVGPETFSEIYFFSHRDHSIRSTFVEIHTSYPHRAVLTLSPGHFLYANNVLVAARNVRPGDSIHIVSATRNVPDARVTLVRRRISRGLYNPHTLHGDIVVDGVRASTFTEAVPLPVAKGLLAPVRTLYSLAGGTWSGLYECSNEGILKIFEKTVWSR